MSDKWVGTGKMPSLQDLFEDHPRVLKWLTDPTLRDLVDTIIKEEADNRSRAGNKAGVAVKAGDGS